MGRLASVEHCYIIHNIMNLMTLHNGGGVGMVLVPKCVLNIMSKLKELVFLSA